jgi:hypothetical protein
MAYEDQKDVEKELLLMLEYVLSLEVDIGEETVRAIAEYCNRKVKTASSGVIRNIIELVKKRFFGK